MMRLSGVLALVVAPVSACVVSGPGGGDAAGGDGRVGHVIASVTVGPDGGTVSEGRVKLVIPRGALREPTTITISEIADPRWGVVGPAFDLAPDGLRFDVPATLSISYDGLEMPPGTERASLRLGVLTGKTWEVVDDGENRADDAEVVAPLEHLSTYGIVPIASEGSGVGTHLAVNGVVLETSEEVFARLAVAPTIVTLSLARGDDRPVEVTLSGLPDDEDQYLYLGSYQDWRVIHPGDGGTATVTTVLDEPRVLWVQPTRGTVVISSDPAVPDQCEAARGVREGGTCTFTDDVEGPVEIVGPGQTLDCAGHTITRVGDSGAVGIVLGMPWNDAPPSAPSDTTVRNCVVGVPGEPFATGLLAWGAQNLAVEDCTFVENFDGIMVGPGANMRVGRNAIVDARRYGISVQGPATTNEVRQNSVTMEIGHAQQAIGVRLAGLFTQAAAGETTFYPRPVTATLVADNAVASGTDGLWLEIASGNELTGNDVDGAERGLFVVDEFAWPNPRRT